MSPACPVPKNQNLAPSTSFAETKDPLTWLQFTASSSHFRPRVSSRVLREEIKQIGATLILDESGEDRLRPESLPPADLRPIDGALYLISDVHLGGEKGGGLEAWKYRQLRRFLRNVARCSGNLVINGDFLELFTDHAALYRNLQPIYRDLRHIKRVIYLPGNHDDQLKPLIGKRWKNISFLNSISIPVEGNVIHIEHGHLSDFSWHHKSEQGGEVIKFVHQMEKIGVNLPLMWGVFINWLFYFCIPLQLLQWSRMDVRIREIRAILPPRLGFSETRKPFTSRFTQPIRGLRRLWWELFSKKDEPELIYILGHHHQADQWIFGTRFFNWLNRRRTRVKLHFTTGCWESHFFWRPLYYLKLDRTGKIERLEVEKMTGTLESGKEVDPEELIDKLLPQPGLLFPGDGNGRLSPRHRFPHLFTASAAPLESSV